MKAKILHDGKWYMVVDSRPPVIGDLYLGLDGVVKKSDYPFHILDKRPILEEIPPCV